MGTPEATQTPPTARIETMAADEQAECDSDQCAYGADLKIIFAGQRTASNHRCLEHWGPGQVGADQCGLFDRLRAQALDWIMRR